MCLLVCFYVSVCLSVSLKVVYMSVWLYVWECICVCLPVSMYSSWSITWADPQRERLTGPCVHSSCLRVKGCCWIMQRCWGSWPPEEKNSIRGQRRGLMAQSFCVKKFYLSIKEIEKASDIGIRSGQKEYPMHVYSGLVSFRIDWFDLLIVQWSLKSLLQNHSSKASILWCSAFFTVQLSHPYMTSGKTTVKGCCWIMMPGFLASGGEEFNPGPETRLDRSELLYNKVLKYKGDRESFWHRHQKGAERVPPC